MGLPRDACTAASYNVVACFICIEEIERPGGHLYERRDKQEKNKKKSTEHHGQTVSGYFLFKSGKLKFQFY
jgi:hypothetical protein